MSVAFFLKQNGQQGKQSRSDPSLYLSLSYRLSCEFHVDIPEGMIFAVEEEGEGGHHARYLNTRAIMGISSNC